MLYVTHCIKFRCSCNIDYGSSSSLQRIQMSHTLTRTVKKTSFEFQSVLQLESSLLFIFGGFTESFMSFSVSLNRSFFFDDLWS